MNRKIGFMAGLDFVSYQPIDVCRILSELGYQSVSWPFSWFDPSNKDDHDRINLIHSAARYGLNISEWVVQLDYVTLNQNIRQQRIDQTICAIQKVAQTGAGAPINVFTGPAPWDSNAPHLYKDISEGKAWELVINAFECFLPVAEKEKVTLAVEPVFGHLVHDYYTLNELLCKLPSPYLMVNFDPSHGVLYGNDTGWVIRQLNKKIAHCHLKDAVGKPGGLPGETFEFPLLGEGQVPWAEFISSLDAIGYEGCLTVEFEAFRYYQQVLHHDPTQAAKQAMQSIQSLGLTG